MTSRSHFGKMNSTLGSVVLRLFAMLCLLTQLALLTYWHIYLYGYSALKIGQIMGFGSFML